MPAVGKWVAGIVAGLIITEQGALILPERSRIGAVAGAVAASLAFAASAKAATTPVMNPIPYYACGNVTASSSADT